MRRRTQKCVRQTQEFADYGEVFPQFFTAFCEKVDYFSLDAAGELSSSALHNSTYSRTAFGTDLLYFCVKICSATACKFFCIVLAKSVQYSSSAFLFSALTLSFTTISI